MIALGERWADGVSSAIRSHGLPWEVQRIGCRAEYWFTPTPPRTGGDAAAADDHELAQVHPPVRAQPRHPAHAVPQHGPDVPATTEADVDAHSAVFDEMATELTA